MAQVQQQKSETHVVDIDVQLQCVLEARSYGEAQEKASRSIERIFREAADGLECMTLVHDPRIVPSEVKRKAAKALSRVLHEREVALTVIKALRTQVSATIRLLGGPPLDDPEFRAGATYAVHECPHPLTYFQLLIQAEQS